MSSETFEPNRPELSAEALREWNGLVENVLRGIAHALNNRAAALSAVIELTSDPDDAGVIGSILSAELGRVGDLVAVVRSIATRKGGADAFAPADAATEALAVLRHHAENRERQVTIDAANAAPVRVVRWMFVRALIALGANASAADGGVKVTIVEEGAWLVTRLGTANAPHSALSPYVNELARAMAGEPLQTPDSYGFRIPTLAALRRSEGRAG
jgi:hypothetical protein